MVVDDPLDGRSIGFHQSLDRHRVAGVTLNYYSGKWTVRVAVAAKGVSGKNSAKGQRARFVVGERVLALESSRRSYPLTGVQPRTGVYTQWQVDFRVSPKRLGQLAESPIRVIGLNVAEVEHRYNLSRRKARRLQEHFTCALQYAGQSSTAVAKN